MLRDLVGGERSSAESGAQLAELMIDHGVGVTTYKRYEIRRLDSDYFTAK